jgi:hypothetical protein
MFSDKYKGNYVPLREDFELQIAREGARRFAQYTFWLKICNFLQSYDLEIGLLYIALDIPIFI